VTTGIEGERAFALDPRDVDIGDVLALRCA
jgi:hypothetical protein